MGFRIATALFIMMISVNIGICQEGASVLKNNTFVMATFRPENDYLGKWHRLAYTEIFRRLGIKIEFRYYPKKRVSIETDAGNVDGEAGRIAAYAVCILILSVLKNLFSIQTLLHLQHRILYRR